VTERAPDITPETTILDILHSHRGTEAIFRRLESETGTCVLCQGLFLSLREAAERFGFPAADILAEIRAAIRDAGV
jgi:hypothetical protein